MNQKEPEGISIASNTRCVALDGDADRLIYFYFDDKKAFHLMDGDRIATLLAGYLMDLVRESGVKVNLGLIQTAYANGNSTDYITNTLVSLHRFCNYKNSMLFYFLNSNLCLLRKSLLPVYQLV